MPRRKRKDPAFQKKIGIIQTRLMQISLVLDDYVYNNKNIDSIEAQAYMEEVSAIKDQCLRDERCLQVVDKLIRCMRGIMAEQEASKNQFNTTDTTFSNQAETNTQLSPVYSTADEDMTQYIDDIDGVVNENTEQINTEANTHFDVDKDVPETSAGVCNDKVTDGIFMDRITDNTLNDLSQLLNNTKSQNNYQLTANMFTESVGTCDTNFNFIDQNIPHIIDTIDLTKECYENIENLVLIDTDEVYLEKAISNLSVNDTVTNEMECSQSILNNFAMPSQNLDLTPYLSTINNKETRITNQEKVNTKEKIQQMKNNNAFSAKPQYINKQIDSTLETYKTNSNIAAKQNTKSKANNNKRGNKKSNENNKKHINKRRPNKKSDVTKRNKKLKDNNKVIKDTKLDTNLSENINNKPKSNNKINEIQNNEVVNDLSWIESIRFVREISEDEFEPISLEENFWNNFSLPSPWSDDLFNY